MFAEIMVLTLGLFVSTVWLGHEIDKTNAAVDRLTEELKKVKGRNDGVEKDAN